MNKKVTKLVVILMLIEMIGSAVASVAIYLLR